MPIIIATLLKELSAFPRLSANAMAARSVGGAPRSEGSKPRVHQTFRAGDKNIQQMQIES
jgi:hypothetical protein